MKPCPYCREEIKDDAVRCRYCTSDLTAPAELVVHSPPEALLRAGGGSSDGRSGADAKADEKPPVAESPPAPSPQPPPSPSPPEPPQPEPQPQPPQPQPQPQEPQPVERTKVIPMPSFPQTAQPPAAAPAPQQAPPQQAPPQQAPAAPPAAAQAAPTARPAGGVPQIMSPARTPSPSPSLTFSHEGPRFILGYSSDYFGLWDKASPGPPLQRFPRSEQGWQQAWEAFMRAEMSG